MIVKPWILLSVAIVLLTNMIARFWTLGVPMAMCLTLLALLVPLLLEESLFCAPAKKSKRLRSTLLLAVGGLIVWQCALISQNIHANPGISDIAEGTIMAADLVVEGKNPYRAAIDPQQTVARWPGMNLIGYKYNPMMFLTFLPSAHFGRGPGLLIMNVFLHLLTLVLIFSLAKRNGGENVGLCAVLFYLLIRFIPTEIRFGVTDLAAVVPLLATAYLWNTRPATAGLFMGISIATKILPAGPLFLLFMPPGWRGRRNYIFASVVGMTPLFIYLAWSPRDFLGNTIFFNMIRATQDSSIFFGMPDWVRKLGGIVFLAAAFSASVIALRKKLTTEQRCALAFTVLMCCLVTGPLVKPNYLLWSLPLFCVLAGRAPFLAQNRR